MIVMACENDRMICRRSVRLKDAEERRMEHIGSSVIARSQGRRTRYGVDIKADRDREKEDRLTTNMSGKRRDKGIVIYVEGAYVIWQQH